MDAWTRYWQSDRLQSCIAADAASDQAISAYWTDFGRSLPAGARLLDLCTGNGAVPAALVDAGLTLSITGVDRAAIDPPRYLTRPARLSEVRFLGGVDLALPDALSDRFLAITSQFGLEYLPREARAGAVARHLDPGGRFQLLAHHRGSEVVTPRKRDLMELERLLEPDGPLDAARRFAHGTGTPAGVAERLAAYVSQRQPGTRRLSGQLVAALKRILAAPAMTGLERRTLAGELYLRVTAEQERLAQLVAAALDDAGADVLANELETAGLAVTAHEPLYVPASKADRVLVGWHLAGHQP